LQQAKKAALETKWEADGNAPEKQVGKIIYVFSLKKIKKQPYGFFKLFT
jgi:hypothetical protein